MRFSLRSTAFTMLALATVAANAAGVPQFYFSDKGGSNDRLLTDTVTSSAWVKEYDVIVKNVGDAGLNIGSANLVVAYAMGLSQVVGTLPIAGTDTVTVFNTSDTSNTNLNSNITGLASWVFHGGLDQVRFRGGSLNPQNNTIARPYGMVVNLTGQLNQSTPLAVGDTMYLATIKFKDNGFYGNGQAFKDIFLYTAPAGAQTGASTVVFNPASPALPTNWENDSRLRLVPEPGTMLALVAGIGALAARRRRK